MYQQVDHRGSMCGLRFMIEFVSCIINCWWWQIYVENRASIRTLQKEITFDLPHFVNLDWRLDIQVIRSPINSRWDIQRWRADRLEIRWPQSLPYDSIQWKTEVSIVEFLSVFPSSSANAVHDIRWSYWLFKNQSIKFCRQITGRN